MGFFIFASSSASIAFLRSDFFQQSQHLRFVTSTIFEAKSADHPGWVVREMYRPGRGVGGAAICGVGTGSAIIGNTEAGSAVIASACIGGGAGRVIGGMFSRREVSQLDNDVFPPSN